tara:strand:- start:2624 stop:3010 length:387 start_codon:yes stop_codon:yes gene_type:complete
MLNSQEVNILGQVCNSTWGESGYGNNKVPTMSVKTSLQGDVMTCCYTTVVILASDRNLRDQTRVFEEESIQVLKTYIKELKKNFKNDAGRSLKTKEVNNTDSLELITASPFTPKRTAYYRRFISYKVD